MFLGCVQWVYFGNMLLVLGNLKVHGKRWSNMLGTLELHPWVWLGISQDYFGSISGNILNVIWWVYVGYMLRSQSKCTQNLISGYIGRKMIRSPQFTQDVPTGFQDTSPPV